MIKSVTIKDESGRLLFKVICRENGVYDMTAELALKNAIIDVRDDKNQKLFFCEGES